LLLITILSWIPIAWAFPDGTVIQRTFIAMSTVFMGAGCVSLYSSDLPALYLATTPSYLAWMAALLDSHNFSYQMIGVVGVLYFISGYGVAKAINRFTINSIKRTVENIGIQEALEESKQSLSMALRSSGAATWSWDLETKECTCEGDLTAVGIQNQIIKGSEDDFLAFFSAHSRENIRASFLAAGMATGEIDVEHRLEIPGRGTMYLAVRGRAHKNADGETVGFKGICWDATGKRSAELVAHERDVQEAANKAKSVFLANASHEMRTPLAAISGYTEALLDETLPPRIREDLLVVQRTGRYLTSLVNDFLDLSRIETGQLYIQKNVISLETEINEVLQIVKPTMDQKNLNLFLDITTALPGRVETDQTRLRQILINMLSNAAKYTESGDVRVSVSFEEQGPRKGNLSVRVIDSGIGITEQIRENLFRPFARGETAFVKRTEGAGLGLALSRSLARALNGDLRLVRSIPGQGSEFEFTLAVDVLEPGKVQTVNETREKVNPILRAEERPLNRMRILVAEDSEDLRELMERVLKSQGAAVDSCGDGKEAIDLALKQPYDAILMDINMPVMDGYQATASLRAKGYVLPIIALTAHASIEHRQMSLEAGCDAYLSKPINSGGLIDVLKKCVQTSRLEKSQHA